MRGPLVDIVLLGLIVAFFGVQQRRRPEAYFRFWLAGWILIVLSIVLYDLPITSAYGLIVQEAVRQSLLLCGALAFAFSFVARQRKAAISLLQAALVSVPLFLATDIIATQSHGGRILILLVLVGEGLTAAMTWMYLKSRGGWLLWTQLALCAIFTAAMIRIIRIGDADALMHTALAHIFIVSGLLFATMRRKGGRTIGTIGFLLWAACYLTTQQWVPLIVKTGALSVWAIPKYLVAFGMLLKLFTKVNAEFADLSARHQTQYEQYRILFDSNPHPMAIYDVESTLFLAVNDATLASYGYTREQLLRMSISQVRSDPSAPRATPVGIASTIDRHQRANGTTFDVDVKGNDVVFEGRQARLVMVMDITEREQLNRELIHQAHHDALTGLPNRVMLEDRIGQWLTRCSRENSMGAFLTIDIDHFKKVNDTYGHQAGDECLKLTAERLRSRVRQVDTIARTGGEEFTIVIGGLKSEDGARKVCAGLLALFQEPVAIPGHNLQLTISIGIALYPNDGADIETLRRRSDQALYQAKRTGRNRAVFASEQPPA